VKIRIHSFEIGCWIRWARYFEFNFSNFFLTKQFLCFIWSISCIHAYTLIRLHTWYIAQWAVWNISFRKELEIKFISFWFIFMIKVVSFILIKALTSDQVWDWFIFFLTQKVTRDKDKVIMYMSCDELSLLIHTTHNIHFWTGTEL